MACFIVPLVQAVATTALRRHVSRQAAQQPSSHVHPLLTQLPRLELMLWGGSAMLIVDHIINGEVIATYPFFTAMLQEDGALTMLREMLTVGVPMSLVVTAIYCVQVYLERQRKEVKGQ